MASNGRHDLLNKDENEISENLNDLFEEIEFLQTKQFKHLQQTWIKSADEQESIH